MDKKQHSNEEEELKNIAPALFGMKKEDQKAPDGYFDTFHTRLQDKITAPEKQSVFARIFARINMKIAIPALVTCGLAVGLVWYLNQSSTESDFQSELLAELEAEDYGSTYTEDDLYLIDSDVFEDYLEEQDELIAEVMNSDVESPQEVDELIDFLLEEGIGLEDIIEEM